MATHTPIQVAAYNGLECHHEMIGYIMAYCQTRSDVQLTVFTTSSNDYAWISVYRGTFPASRFLPVSAFSPKEFDHIILLTDDDWSFPSLDPADQGKLLCIDHFYELRRLQPALRRMSTRFFPNRPDAVVVVPTYCLVDEKDKRLALSSASGASSDACISIACIGSTLEEFSTQQQFVQHVRALFPRNLSPRNLSSVDRPLHFHLFHRRPLAVMDGACGTYVDERLSITSHTAADADTMVAILRRSDYVLMGGGDARQLRFMSGSCPLAYSCGCRLITSADWKAGNLMASPLEFNQMQTQTEPLTALEGRDLALVYAEAARLWAHRDAVLDTFI